MKSYYRIMLGRKGVYLDEAIAGGFIGAGWLSETDLSNELSGDWRSFNEKFRSIYLEQRPDSTKIAAGLACGMLFTICKGINTGDIVLSPDGKGFYFIGEVTGDYTFHPSLNLPHRRSVRWFDQKIARQDMTDSLQHSAGSIGTVSDVSKYAEELERLLVGKISHNPDEEDAGSFAMEKHLEDFLVQNWNQTELGQKYDIYQEDGEMVGQQYPSDTGPMDILAISKDKKELLVVELKRGRVGDAVVGQVLRYMGFVKDELAEPDQTVKGIVIALEDDIRIRRALSVLQNIDFYLYKISFKLEKM
jgi:restriction system protein